MNISLSASFHIPTPLSKMSESKRRPQFTATEIEVLRKGYIEKKVIIEVALSKSVTKKIKDEVWDDITRKVNSVAQVTGGVGDRTREEVKKYKNLKSATKERIVAERKSQKKTGGGPPDLPAETEDEFSASFRGNEAFEGISNGVKYFT